MEVVSKTQQQIDRLAKSTQNVVNAKNPAQREAAEKFLVMRAQELDTEKRKRVEWLHEADTWVNEHKPEINADADHEHNQEWLERLNEYQDIEDALKLAWDALMASKGAA